MNKLKPLRLLGLSTLAVSALGLSASNVIATDFSSISSLPVITDDCGGDGCADRRDMSLEDIKAMLAAAASGETNTGSAIDNRAIDPSDVFYGLGTNETQIVWLNFDASSPTFQAIPFSGVPETFVSHVFTQEERDEIQARIESDYANYNIGFTQTQPASGDYSTVDFECGLEDDGICINFFGGILFGRAQSIDVGNKLRNDSAFADANLWEVVVAVDPTGGFLTSLTGIPVVDGDVQAALSQAVINQAANTGAHELGHNLGLRHHDAFGAPGSGLPSTGTPAPTAFYPTFDGLQEGDETTSHTMVSGASGGSSLADSANRDRFISERSAIKLKANERGRLTLEEGLSDGVEKVRLRRVSVPNTIVDGENAGKKLGFFVSTIQGALSEAGELDYYKFYAVGGNSFTAEFNGFDVPVGDPVIGTLRLYYQEQDGSLTFVAENFQNFEGFDAFLIDAPLEKTGNYVIEVSSPDFVFLERDEDLNPVPFPLEATGNGALRSGDYLLSMYVIAERK